ncbi:hypothetical protein [Macrococcus bovicus]|uniref:Uncharacterized protein n=1 Tax=Macrococcus bovicus TaxID=69968 RepID=A0A4R6BXD8_9STAP|nr:hypothetical protein [Macrococcus bovicus]TDM12997.1 hypothetical protein ERX55_09920 [Macrococcus bovicus]
MNKWVKLGLGAGATYLTYRAGRKVLSKYDDVNTLMNDIVGHENYDDLRNLVFQVLDMMTGTQKLAPHESVPADAPKVETTDESIAGAIKSIVDMPFVAEMIPDQKNVQMIKEVIDEAAEVEKLIRGWFK